MSFVLLYPSASSSVVNKQQILNQLHEDDWVTLQLCPTKRIKRLLLCGMYGSSTDVNAVSVCSMEMLQSGLPCVRPEKALPHHATLLMAGCIWWRLPPTHQQPLLPVLPPNPRETPSGLGVQQRSLLPSAWPALLYTENNLWCEVQAFSSDCTSTVGQDTR